MSMLHDFMKKDKMEDVTVFIDKLRRTNCIVSKHLVRKPINHYHARNMSVRIFHLENYSNFKSIKALLYSLLLILISDKHANCPVYTVFDKTEKGPSATRLSNDCKLK